MFIVTLNDEGISEPYPYFERVADWSADHCPSFVGSEVVDVSDVSPYHDVVAEYRFTSETDVVFFKLRWL